MTVNRTAEYLVGLVTELRKLPEEIEWVEFKQNNFNPEEIGEYISALSNSAALCGKTHAYVVWGIAGQTHDIVGTVFRPATEKRGNEDLESWLLRLLNPRLDFWFRGVEIEGKSVVVLEIPRAYSKPVQFQGLGPQGDASHLLPGRRSAQDVARAKQPEGLRRRIRGSGRFSERLIASQ